MHLGRTLIIGCLAVAISACAAPTASLVYSFQELDCSSCLGSVAKDLSERPGVSETRVDKDRVAVEVVYDVTAETEEGLDQAVEAKGFQWSRDAEAGSWAPEIPFPEGMDVQKVSHDGEVFDLTAQLVAGKVTVFDFYAPWCGPCRVVTHELKSIMGERSDVALRKANIVDWDRPVVAQHLKGVANIPFLLVYGKDGTKVAAITGVKKRELREAIVKAGGPAPAPSSEPPPSLENP